MFNRRVREGIGQSRAGIAGLSSQQSYDNPFFHVS